MEFHQFSPFSSPYLAVLLCLIPFDLQKKRPLQYPNDYTFSILFYAIYNFCSLERFDNVVFKFRFLTIFRRILTVLWFI